MLISITNDRRKNMGAWGYKILDNDKALDVMYELEDMRSNPTTQKNVCNLIKHLLTTSEYSDEILLCIGLVDISINGINPAIIGNAHDYDEFFTYIQKKPMINLKSIALKRLEEVKKSDLLSGWVEECIEPRKELLELLENRLK